MKLHHRILIATFDLIRPVFGFMNSCCIYPTSSCSDYAKLQITTKPLYVSIPFIIIRVVSCNPITKIFFKKQS